MPLKQNNILTKHERKNNSFRKQSVQVYLYLLKQYLLICSNIENDNEMIYTIFKEKQLVCNQSKYKYVYLLTIEKKNGTLESDVQKSIDKVIQKQHCKH